MRNADSGRRSNFEAVKENCYKVVARRDESVDRGIALVGFEFDSIIEEVQKEDLESAGPKLSGQDGRNSFCRHLVVIKLLIGGPSQCSPDAIKRRRVNREGCFI